MINGKKDGSTMFFDKKHLYIAHKDRMGECLDNMKYRIDSDDFVSVVGSFIFLNYIRHGNYKNITLFDINPYQVDFAKFFIELIINSKDIDEFFENYFLRKLDNSIFKINHNYFLNKELDKGIVDRVKENTKNNYFSGWDDIIKNPKSIYGMDFLRRIEISMPVYANLKDQQTLYLGYGWLKNNESFLETKNKLLNSNIDYKVMNIFEEKSYFEGLPDYTVIYISNINRFFKDKRKNFFLNLASSGKKLYFFTSHDGLIKLNIEKNIEKKDFYLFSYDYLFFTLKKKIKKIIGMLKYPKKLTTSSHKKLWRLIKKKKKKLDNRNILEIVPYLNHNFYELKKYGNNYSQVTFLDKELYNKIKENDIILIHGLLSLGVLNQEKYKKILEEISKHNKKIIVFENEINNDYDDIINSYFKDFKKFKSPDFGENKKNVLYFINF